MEQLDAAFDKFCVFLSDVERPDRQVGDLFGARRFRFRDAWLSQQNWSGGSLRRVRSFLGGAMAWGRIGPPIV